MHVEYLLKANQTKPTKPIKTMGNLVTCKSVCAKPWNIANPMAHGHVVGTNPEKFLEE